MRVNGLNCIHLVFQDDDDDDSLILDDFGRRNGMYLFLMMLLLFNLHYLTIYFYLTLIK